MLTFCQRPKRDAFGLLGLGFCLLFASCAAGRQTELRAMSNPCADARAGFVLRSSVRTADCGDDPQPAGTRYVLLPEYGPVAAVMLSENLVRQHGDTGLIQALLKAGVDVWYLGLQPPAPELSPLPVRPPAGRLVPLAVKTNSSWTRDWGPLFAAGARELRLVDVRYAGRNVEADDAVPAQLKHALRTEPLLPEGVRITKTSLPVTLEGGNLLCNDKLCFVSAKVATENPSQMQRITADFKKRFTQSLNLVDLMPQEPNGHLDLWVKFLRTDLLAIAELRPETLEQVPPEAGAYYRQLRDFLELQASGRDARGKPVPGALASQLRRLDPTVRIVRVPLPLPILLNETPLFRSYVNSLLINGTAVLPRFERLFLSDGDQAYPDADERAQNEARAEKVYRQAGYKVLWVNADRLVPYGGTWHCVAAQVPRLATQRR